MMRLSLHARLILVAVMTGIGALGFAGVAIGDVLEHVVRRNFNEKLDTQAQIVERAIASDGRLIEARVVPLPGFDRNDRGWGWRVEAPAGRWQGGESFYELEIRGPGRRRGPAEVNWGRARTREGEPLHVRQHIVKRPQGEYRIETAGPLRVMARPLRAAMAPLLASLGLLGVGLAIASLIQLRVGLKPVRSLREAVARVRSGDDDHLPEDQPKEFLPLVQEVNALIEQNAAGLANARNHTANLAHGLKTPLATLALRLEREGSDEETRAIVAQLDKRIAHHLRRARSAAVGSGERARSELGQTVDDLRLAMGHVHADRAIEIESRVAGSVELAVDREDLDEILGNLMDNACRFAKARVRISSELAGARAIVRVEDDGPGIPDAELDQALTRGTRLDETSRGYGFGLGIVQEIANLYGGELALARSVELKGLCAQLILPRRI